MEILAGESSLLVSFFQQNIVLSISFPVLFPGSWQLVWPAAFRGKTSVASKNKWRTFLAFLNVSPVRSRRGSKRLEKQEQGQGTKKLIFDRGDEYGGKIFSKDCLLTVTTKYFWQDNGESATKNLFVDKHQRKIKFGFGI